MRTALLLAAALLLPPGARGAAGGAAGGGEGGPAGADAEEFDDDDSDSAPFMIVVEHPSPGRYRCAGSLVSLRTGVTTAACARGRGAARAHELWALAAAAAAGLATRAAGARRVVRLAAAGAQDAADARAPPWAGAVLDLAVLELEAPFGSAAHARPILMATAAGECGAAGAACHVVRAQPSRVSRRARLRIVDAHLAPDAACAALARYWAAVRDQALCLAGPELCASDWGAGVVCGGKLCGVVSRSARAGAAPGGAGAECGDTHAAQSVASWRRFLHCAHTLRACGRGECAEVCWERRLVDADAAGPAAGGGPELRDDYGDARLERRLPRPLAAADLAAGLGGADEPQQAEEPSTRAPAPCSPRTSSTHGAARPAHAERTNTRPPPRTPTRTPRPAPPAPPRALSSVRPTPLFEPNRPDFHAGEYGDNAAEYAAGAEEPAAPTRTAPAPLAAGAGAGGVGGAGEARRRAVAAAAAARRVAPSAPPAPHALDAPAAGAGVLAARPRQLLAFVFFFTIYCTYYECTRLDLM